MKNPKCRRFRFRSSLFNCFSFAQRRVGRVKCETCECIQGLLTAKVFKGCVIALLQCLCLCARCYLFPVNLPKCRNIQFGHSFAKLAEFPPTSQQLLSNNFNISLYNLSLWADTRRGSKLQNVSIWEFRKKEIGAEITFSVRKLYLFRQLFICY